MNARKATTIKITVAAKCASAVLLRGVRELPRMHRGESVEGVTECLPEMNAMPTTVVRTKKGSLFVKNFINAENVRRWCHTKSEDRCGEKMC